MTLLAPVFHIDISVCARCRRPMWVTRVVTPRGHRRAAPRPQTSFFNNSDNLRIECAGALVEELDYAGPSKHRAACLVWLAPGKRIAMKTRTRSILLWILGAVLLLLGAAGAIGYATFGGMAPVVDGQRLGGVVEVVEDSFVSVALLDTGDGHAALIDCGNDPEARAIKAALARRGLGFSDVHAVFVTHGHPDHVGGCARFSEATVYMFDADIALAGSLVDEPYPVADGDAITVGDLVVSAYAIPGHTVGSGAYLVDDVLFVGDSAGVTDDHRLVGAPWIFSDDTALNLVSLRALGRRLATVTPRPSVLVPAHSGVLDGDVASSLSAM